MKNKIKFRTFKETFDRDIRGDKNREFLFLVEKAQLKLAEKLLEIREQRGLTQVDLAKKMGVSQQMVSQIESGDENLTLETIFRLLIALKTILRIEFLKTSKKEPKELLRVA